jgi:hypothetical protein
LQRYDNVSHILPEAVEAHRRLNALMVNLDSTDRLAASYPLRKQARALERESTASLSPSRSVRNAVFQACALSNANLSETYLGGAQFGPDQAWAAEDPMITDDADLENRLFDVGLGFMLRQVDGLPLAGGMFDHTLFALPALIQHCREAPVILTLVPQLTEFLAAGIPDCLIYVASCDKLRNIRTLYALDTADSSGRVVFLDTDAPDVLPCPTIWKTEYFRHPDLILLPLHQAPDLMEPLSKQITRPVQLVFLSGDMGLYKSVTLRPTRDHPDSLQAPTAMNSDI